MSGLMNRAEQRRGLKRAGDADTDPASITASENAIATTVRVAGVPDVGDAADSSSTSTVVNASESASLYGSASAGQAAGSNASDAGGAQGGGEAVGNAGASASRAGSTKAPGKAGRSTGKSSSRKAGRRPRRGVGRPPGPDRQPITVRVLAEHDALLTTAWTEQGMRPQQVIDAALAEWFDRHRTTG